MSAWPPERAPQTPVTVAIGLGSNEGDRLALLSAARAALAAALDLTAVSPVFATPPWGVLNQPPFLNAACLATTTLAPLALLALLKHTEQTLGRQAGRRWGPRLIDLDLLLYGAHTVDAPTLTVPHRHLHERAFALIPLACIAPDWPHPVLGRTVAALAAAADPEGIALAAAQWPS